MSVDYYVRLEQGRVGKPSPTVLAGLVRALNLSPNEREHLYRLAKVQPTQLARRAREHVRPTIRRLLEVLDPSPALVLGRSLNILAWNPAAAALLPDLARMPEQRRNLILFVFLDESAKGFYVEWEKVARQCVTRLRMSADRNPDDPSIAELVGELSMKDKDFRVWWTLHDVTSHYGEEQFFHPTAGTISLDYEVLHLPGHPDCSLIVYSAPRNSASEDALNMLYLLRSEGGSEQEDNDHHSDGRTGS